MKNDKYLKCSVYTHIRGLALEHRVRYSLATACTVCDAG